MGCCSVVMEEASLAHHYGIANGEPMITSKVVCDGQSVHEDTVKVSDIAPVEIEGTPLTLFALQPEYCAVALISGTQGEAFTLTDSLFVELPVLDEADLYQNELRSALVIEDASVVVRNTVFANNTGYMSGGAYLVVTDDSTSGQEFKVRMENCTFDNSRGELAGGIVVDGFPSVEIVRSSFTSQGPVAIRTMEASIGSQILIQDSHFEGVPAGKSQTGKSGAIMGMNPGVINIENTIFERNKKEYGGAVAWQNLGTDDLVQLGFTDCVFADNVGQVGGGAIFAGMNVALTINSTRFNSNNAGGGGACMLAGATSGHIENSEFAGNIATSGGGAIKVTFPKKLYSLAENEQVDTSLSLVDVKFMENKCEDGNGGAILSEVGTISIGGSSFLANTASDNGGALALYSNPTIDISGSSFDSNSVVDASGGAIYAEEVGALVIEDTTFKKNKAVTPCIVSSVLMTNFPTWTASNASFLLLKKFQDISQFMLNYSL